MPKDILYMTIFCFVGYLILRILIGLNVKLYCSKKEYKIYKHETNLMQRFFLFWVKKNSRVKYLKSENRYINYPVIMSVYFYINLTNFISTIIVFIIEVLVSIDVLATNYAELGACVFLIETLLSFVIFALVVNYEHRNYHIKRQRRRW